MATSGVKVKVAGMANKDLEASSPATSVEILKVLVEDVDVDVRSRVALNEANPVEARLGRFQ